MKLNPITALTDSLSKLIVEHGSAVITEKNLAFLRDKMAVAEREIAKLTTRLEKSESKNQSFRTQLQNLKNENRGLKKKIETYDKFTHDHFLDKEQILILQCLASLAPNHMYPLEVILSTCNLAEQIARYHLQELEDQSMIECEFINGAPHWFLDHDGRGYLINNKLIS